jgi:riboflavin transporter FmnP
MAMHLSTYHSADYYHFNTPKKECIGMYMCVIMLVSFVLVFYLFIRSFDDNTSISPEIG